MAEERYIAIVYKRNWNDFDVAQTFRTEDEAHEFARSKINSSVVIAKGDTDDWYWDRLGKPIAFYWCGKNLLRNREFLRYF